MAVSEVENVVAACAPFSSVARTAFIGAFAATLAVGVDVGRGIRLVEPGTSPLPPDPNCA
jgi:hypothetical protein